MARGRKRYQLEGLRANRYRRRRLPPLGPEEFDRLIELRASDRTHRWRRIQSLDLSFGCHNSLEEGCNVLEAASYLAGEPWSSTPRCVSWVVTVFLRRWNDDLPSNESRNRLLKPLIPKIVESSLDPHDEELRSWMCADWLVRECAPAFLCLDGRLDQAQELAALTPLTGERRELARDGVALQKAKSTVLWMNNEEDAIPASGIAQSIAFPTIWAVACSAALEAARTSADEEVRLVASEAAEVAFDAAIRAVLYLDKGALEPAVENLQSSAVRLLESMLDLGR